MRFMGHPIGGRGAALIVAAAAILFVVIEGPFALAISSLPVHQFGNPLIHQFQPAQAAPAGGAQPPSPNPPPAKSLVPVAFSTIGKNPDPYYGELVSLTATVVESFSKFGFSIDQDRTKPTGKDVLVLARRMSDPITLNAWVTVVGELVKFDPIETPAKAKEFTIDLPPGIAARWTGRPTILATAVVVNDKSVDLARFIPPPKTPEEDAYNKVMRSVSSANGELRKGVQASNVELVKKSTAALQQAFADAEAFWKKRGKTDATKWAADARIVVESIDKAAAGPDWAAAKTSADVLAKACTTCHGAYRERLEDGSFRVKPGTD